MQSVVRLALGLCLLAGSLFARETSVLNPHLSAFEPFVGRTWSGEFADSTPENPKIDVMTIERALNGQAVRIFHSINDGDYGGESVLYYDRESEEIVFYYFTTAGFMTQGVTRFEDGKMISVEDVIGNENGITKVESIGEEVEPGVWRSSSRYLQNGKWVPGHSIDYRETPDAEVRFR